MGEWIHIDINSFTPKLPQPQIFLANPALTPNPPGLPTEFMLSAVQISAKSGKGKELKQSATPKHAGVFRRRQRRSSVLWTSRRRHNRGVPIFIVGQGLQVIQVMQEAFSRACMRKICPESELKKASKIKHKHCYFSKPWKPRKNNVTSNENSSDSGKPMQQYSANVDTISCDAPYSAIGFRGKFFLQCFPPPKTCFWTAIAFLRKEVRV